MNSLNKIKEAYYSFSDAAINKFSYEPTSNKIGLKGRVIIDVCCMGKYKNDNFENIKIILEDVIEFRYVEKFNFDSTVIDEAFFGKNKHGNIIDFFPLDTGEKIIPDESSDFSVTFGKITIVEEKDFDAPKQKKKYRGDSDVIDN